MKEELNHTEFIDLSEKGGNGSSSLLVEVNFIGVDNNRDGEALLIPSSTPPYILRWIVQYLLRRYRARLHPYTTVQVKFDVASLCDVVTGVLGFVEGVGRGGR